MKYRIKIITRRNGRKEYWAQVKRLGFWVSIDHEGNVYYLPTNYEPSREMALKRIDLHYLGYKKSVSFEHINK